MGKVRRTPRGYDGTSLPGKKVSEIALDFLSELSKEKGSIQEALFQEWMQILGKEMAPLTKPLKFYEGILTVQVKSSGLYSLLCQHEKFRLLKRLQKKFPVRDLKFRVG